MKSRPCFARYLLAVFVLVCGVAWGQPDGWRGWDHYSVFLWSVGPQPAGWTERVREAGFTGIPVFPGGQPPQGLDYYVENLVAELAFLHARKPIYDADFRAYTSTRDKRYLIRKPCFDDPDFWTAVTARLDGEAARYVKRRPLLYDLRDEPSIGAYSSPMDYCFCPYTLRAFREWLKTRYPSLAALNQEWETSFARWDDVTPMTTFEIKDREKAALRAGRPENYAPWADHREYMDWSFARTLNRMRSILHARDPKTPVGIEGSQMPSAWGGYDLWRIAQAVDWIEPYDIANSRAILGSFLPAEAPVLCTYFGANVPELRRTAWDRLLDGDRGAVVWDDDPERVIAKNAPGLPVTQRGRDIGAIFSEIEAAAPKFAGRRPISDHIAIHYSQASIRAHWMFDSREDGATWPRRFSLYERDHSRLAKARAATLQVVEDLGLNADFVSYEQIENDELIKGGYKVLLLPESVAMSAAECRRIEAFVRAGGVVVADHMVATMDEHGRRLRSGQLDALFGVRQSTTWSPAAGGGGLPSRIPGADALQAFDSRLGIAGGARSGTIPEAPMVVRNGSAFYLNLDMKPYSDLRGAWPLPANYAAVFRAVFAAAGIAPPIQVQGAHDVRVRRYAAPGVEYVTLLWNPAPGGTRHLDSRRIRVVLPSQSRVTESGRDLGQVRELDVTLEFSRPVVLEVRPQ